MLPVVGRADPGKVAYFTAAVAAGALHSAEPGTQLLDLLPKSFYLCGARCLLLDGAWRC